MLCRPTDLTILLPQSPRGWAYRRAPPYALYTAFSLSHSVVELDEPAFHRPSSFLRQGEQLHTAPVWIFLTLHAWLDLQTEDKEFDDLEERFQWVSLCVTELKSNVAAYMDNLEVRTLQSSKARPTSCRDSGVRCQPGKLAGTL